MVILVSFLVTAGILAVSNAQVPTEQQTILDTHNQYRALHNATALTWDPKLADAGALAIQACQFKHSGGKYGENLAAGHKDFATAIKAWYDEEKKYDYNQPGFSGDTGHFTQVVWKGTKSVGCAKKFCAESNWNIYVCEYDPPGNMVDDGNKSFRQNVLPKSSGSPSAPGGCPSNNS
ncbi:CAP domain-containing protein [Mortierella sp. GBAus27b]|nr:hypothetical protein BGX31_009161 [Mortierella sp. GBA43]KAI8351135.1 CAP domain-containing protein [Mortierella sp. GBAus27b]